MLEPVAEQCQSIALATKLTERRYRSEVAPRLATLPCNASTSRVHRRAHDGGNGATRVGSKGASNALISSTAARMLS
jgi:hypothetical protein